MNLGSGIFNHQTRTHSKEWKLSRKNEKLNVQVSIKRMVIMTEQFAIKEKSIAKNSTLQEKNVYLQSKNSMAENFPEKRGNCGVSNCATSLAIVQYLWLLLSECTHILSLCSTSCLQWAWQSQEKEIESELPTEEQETFVVNAWEIVVLLLELRYEHYCVYLCALRAFKIHVHP
jgi:hypothetical protein